MDKTNLYKEIIKCLSKIELERNIEHLKITDNLFKDYNLDSMQLIELVLQLEDAFNIEFDILNLNYDNFENVDKIADMILKIKNILK